MFILRCAGISAIILSTTADRKNIVFFVKSVDKYKNKAYNYNS